MQGVHLVAAKTVSGFFLRHAWPFLHFSYYVLPKTLFRHSNTNTENITLCTNSSLRRNRFEIKSLFTYLNFRHFILDVFVSSKVVPGGKTMASRVEINRTFSVKGKHSFMRQEIKQPSKNSLESTYQLHFKTAEKKGVQVYSSHWRILWSCLQYRLRLCFDCSMLLMLHNHLYHEN